MLSFRSVPEKQTAMAEMPDGGAVLLRGLKPALIDALSADSDYVLQHADSLSLLSLAEYRRVKALADPSEKTRDLLDCVIQKGRDPAEIFLGFLKTADAKETFPKLSAILERVESRQEDHGEREIEVRCDVNIFKRFQCLSNCVTLY